MSFDTDIIIDQETGADAEVSGTWFDGDPDVGCYGGWEDVTLGGELIDSSHPDWDECCDALNAELRDHDTNPY